MRNKLLGLFLIGLSLVILKTEVFKQNIASAVEMGHIIVVKDAIPNGPQDFMLENNGTFSNGNPWEFLLDDDGDETFNPPFSVPRERNFEVFPGSGFRIFEINMPAGWSLVAVDCGGKDNMNFAVEPGETVLLRMSVCPFFRCFEIAESERVI